MLRKCPCRLWLLKKNTAAFLFSKSLKCLVIISIIVILVSIVVQFDHFTAKNLGSTHSPNFNDFNSLIFCNRASQSHVACFRCHLKENVLVKILSFGQTQNESVSQLNSLNFWTKRLQINWSKFAFKTKAKKYTNREIVSAENNSSELLKPSKPPQSQSDSGASSIQTSGNILHNKPADMANQAFLTSKVKSWNSRTRLTELFWSSSKWPFVWKLTEATRVMVGERRKVTKWRSNAEIMEEERVIKWKWIW